MDDFSPFANNFSVEAAAHQDFGTPSALQALLKYKCKGLFKSARSADGVPKS